MINDQQYVKAQQIITRILERNAPYLASRVPFRQTMDFDTPVYEAVMNRLLATAKRCLERLLADNGVRPL